MEVNSWAPFDDSWPDTEEYRREKRECELRENDPAVKEAWEKYQTVLRLKM